MTNIAIFSALLAIVGLCLLIGRLRSSSKFFGTLLVAMAIGVVIGTFVIDYSQRDSNPSDDTSEITKMDEAQDVSMSPLYFLEVGKPWTEMSSTITKVYPNTDSVTIQRAPTPERRIIKSTTPAVENTS